MTAVATGRAQDNGIIRVGRKGLKKFAFGEDGEPFELDVVNTFQAWVGVDESYRPAEEDAEGLRPIPIADMPAYHAAAVAFVKDAAKGAAPEKLTTAEALDFLARLREEYDGLVSFFRPKSSEKPKSPDSSGPAMRFSAEES